MAGNEDTLNTFKLFATDNGLDIPVIRRESFLPDYLIAHRTRVRTDEQPKGIGAVHFFLEDYRFEAVWKSPGRSSSYVRNVGHTLSPDFSLYANWPLSVQLFNVYRNRWLGAFWQSEGIRVIPTVAWSDADSFSFCFLGVVKGSTVAVSTVGVNGRDSTEEERKMFREGYSQMLEQVEPEQVLIYGESPKKVVGEELLSKTAVKTYPSRWQSIRHVKRSLAEQSQEERQEEKAPKPTGASGAEDRDDSKQREQPEDEEQLSIFNELHGSRA